MSEPYLQLNVRHTIGNLKLDARFIAASPWTVLFGPSGSGKTTVLRAIAGLLRPNEGRITLLGRQVYDSAAHIFLPAHLRPIRWSAQKSALFPLRNVRANLAMGMTQEGDAAARPLAEMLELCLDHFDLRELAHKRPAQLSGGESQRVAVVRAAIAARGKVLLLDEPFSGLDAEVRDRLIAQLRVWLAETPVISVTHDVAEAFLLGAEVVRIAEGRVVAQGPVEQVLAKQKDRLLKTLGRTL